MQKTDWLNRLPETLDRQIRTAYVPPHVKALFSYLPQVVRLSARLAEPLPQGAAQLCKLALSATQLQLEHLELIESTQQTSLSLSLHDRTVQLDAELGSDLGPLTRKALQTLFAAEELFVALEDFSFQSSTLSSLQRITQQMLFAQDLERLTYLMLLGMTSGEALGFHRAVFFAYDETTKTLQGTRAIGPSNKEEAHRIWEELEYHDTTIEHLAAESSQQGIDVRLQQQVMNKSIPAKEIEEVLLSNAPLMIEPARTHPVLAALQPTGPIVMAPMRARQRLIGVIFVDHVVTAAPPSKQQELLLSLFIEQTSLLWENLSLLKRLENLASFDGLTGVLTRREFDARFAEELIRCHREQTPCSMLLVDLDSFKQINDTQGHAAGDEVLRRVGALLRRELRKNDLVGRFGGDEFIVFLPRVKQAELAMIAARVLQAMSADNIMTSIGGASFPESCGSPDELFSTADQNLYRAKHNGKNQLALGSMAP